MHLRPRDDLHYLLGPIPGHSRLPTRWPCSWQCSSSSRQSVRLRGSVPDGELHYLRTPIQVEISSKEVAIPWDPRPLGSSPGTSIHYPLIRLPNTRLRSSVGHEAQCCLPDESNQEGYRYTRTLPGAEPSSATRSAVSLISSLIGAVTGNVTRRLVPHPRLPSSSTPVSGERSLRNSRHPPVSTFIWDLQSRRHSSMS